MNNQDNIPTCGAANRSAERDAKYSVVTISKVVDVAYRASSVYSVQTVDHYKRYKIMALFRSLGVDRRLEVHRIYASKGVSVSRYP